MVSEHKRGRSTSKCKNLLKAEAKRKERAWEGRVGQMISWVRVDKKNGMCRFEEGASCLGAGTGRWVWALPLTGKE